MRQSLRLLAFVALAVAAGIAVPALQRESEPVLVQANTAPPAGAETPAVAAAGGVPESRQAIRLSFAPVVERVAPAVVNVYATSQARNDSPFEGDPFFERFFGGGPFGSPFGMPRERARSSLGSGVIVDPSGLVVTNDHVISGATEIRVALADGRQYEAETLLRDERADLAVLKIDGDDPFPVLPFGDSDALQVGDLVLAVGNPFGVGQTVTSGIVSAVARTGIGINDSAFFIQTDAAINPGNSGGALVDIDGNLAGINTAIFSRSGGSIGIGFAIPVNMVRTIVAEALAGGTEVARPWIGILTQEVTPDIAASLGLAAPHGALVAQIDPDSPAERAGLLIGDLILSADGREIGDPAGLDYRLAVAGIGKPVELQIWRDGEAVDLAVVAESEPELDEGDLMRLGGRSPLAGALVADLTTSLAQRLEIRGANRGAVIVDVEPYSPAHRTGFRPGDVVTGLQGEAVRSAEDLAGLVEEGSRIWRITLSRDGRVSNVVLGG